MLEVDFHQSSIPLFQHSYTPLNLLVIFHYSE